MIRLDRVTFSYGDTPVLRDVTWQLPGAGVSCLWGPSGCGKTTILRLLAGLEQPDSGYIIKQPSTAVLPDNSSIPAVTTDWRPKRVAMVFQEDRLLPWLTALQNVTVVGAGEAAARNMLLALGLTEEELASLPTNLSGGQQRRVALARALAADSDLLLLDEPFNGLDEETWRTAVPLIGEYATHRPVVLVTHVREQALALDARMVPLTETPLSGELAVVDFL
ncbi:MAG: ATP-binding cassette domain-containing protein [Clostridia bacterium]|nr:ATP-binding cassette domain-containing protein [Clostridia bacterium]